MEVIVDTTKGVYRERIVRCCECRFFIDNLTEDDTDEAYGECCFDWDIKMPTADDFCSYGEPNSSEKPNNCEPQTCSVNGRPYSECADCEYFKCTADEPQTERSE